MKIPFKPVAIRAAASMPSTLGRRFANDTLPTVLMATTGQIHLATYDGSAFTNIMNATVTGTPSWVEFVEPNKLYAVDEASSEMRLYHLDIHGANGTGPSLSPEPIAVAEGSAGNVHLAFNQKYTRMLSSGYTNGTIDVWDTTGDKLSLIKTIESTGEPNPDVGTARAHQAVLDPSGRFFAVNDLGTDEILVIDSAEDAYSHIATVNAPKGCGPRHGVFHSSSAAAQEATHYLLLCETSNEIISYELTYSDSELSFEEIAKTSTFVDDTPDNAAAGEIAIASDGVNLYASNRFVEGGEGNIARFYIEDGVPTIIDEKTTHGKLPRMFSFDKSGDTIFVGNQNGPNAVVALKRTEDGTIEDEPVGTLPLSDFGGADFMGPAYIKQIK